MTVQTLGYVGEVRYVPSLSRPGHLYPMVWAPVSGWVHADNTCPAFKECRHRREAANMTSLQVIDPQTGTAIAARDVLLVEYDAAAISRGVDVEVAAKWVYDLAVNGRGVGVRGVEEGVRLLASNGEIIRVDEVVCINQDEREAMFIATACRYVMQDDKEIKLDSQQRGKRVSKWEAHSADYMAKHPGAPAEYFVDKWFELGIVKASRNAALALMPSNVKTAILRAGLDAIAEMKRSGGSSQRPAPAQRSQASRPPAARQEPIDAKATKVEAPDAETATAIDAILMEFKDTWDPATYRDTYTELRNEYAPGQARLVVRDLTSEAAVRLLAALRKMRGDPAAPATDEATDSLEPEPEQEGA